MDDSINKKEEQERREFLQSMDVAADKRAQLKQLFPEAFTEDKVDFDQLKRVLGDWIDPGKERFGLTWPGKAECMRVIQEPSIATLKPVRAESVDFDKTENLFIEGDNLEVLKLLQKSYYGKIKLIYIDPPYNTGKEFIYPDKYSETLETYLDYTGQVDGEGRRFSTNTEAEGRFHSRWLSMMYPRLYLARNLLREDGVIFISIDDNEFHNLKNLCDEIFGQENHLATLQVKVRYEGKTLVEDMDFQKLTEQVLIYSKSDQTKLNKKSGKYSYENFRFKIIEKAAPKAVTLGGKKVEIFNSGGYEIVEVEPSEDGLKEIWASGKILDGNSSGRFFRDYLSSRPSEDGLGILYKVYGIGEERSGYRYFTGPKKEGATKGKYYQSVPSKVLSGEETERSRPIVTFYDFADSFGNCRHEGGVDFRDGKKPLRFLTTLIDIITTDENDIFLDFFAGSCSFAHAVIEYNRKNGGQRRCISIQLPEPTAQEDYKTIADIGKERIRRAGAKIAGENDGKLDLEGGAGLDLGFKVFKLDRSNFRIWDGKVESDEKLIEQLELHVDHLNKQSSTEDILYELLLKAGFPLTTKIEVITRAQRPVYSVAEGEMLICLEKELTAELIDSIAELEPSRVVFLDEGFKSNDQLKANAVQAFKSRAANREREIVFRTV